MSNNHFNQIIIASAGSRKTTYIVNEALSNEGENILILTYTLENIMQIRKYIILRVGFIPSNITIQSWYSFLLQDCVRPYQNFVYEDKRIEYIFYPENLLSFNAQRRYIKKENIKKYFLIKERYIINEHISEFATICNEKSSGKVISRLEGIYSKLFIDEVQDISGYDFDLIELLLKSKISCHFVGDCRQATYFTTCSPKYKKFRGKNIINLFQSWEKVGLCSIIERNNCFRSNQIICDFAEKLYPNLSKSTSFNTEQTGHDGLFIVKTEQVSDYIQKYNPIVLRYDKNSNTLGYEAKNFGATKGQTFERVLIFPTDGFKKYLSDKTLTKVVRKKNKRTGAVKEEIKDAFHIAKLYVAITRARTSVAFVLNSDSAFKELMKYQ